MLCRRGHVATIHPGKDFYIALSEHSDWSSGHTVWGYVEDMAVVDELVALPYHIYIHETYGTVMRMMDTRTQFTVSLSDPAQTDSLQQLQ